MKASWRAFPAVALAVGFGLGASTPLRASDLDEGASRETLGDYELLQYVAASRFPPRAVAALDNNGAILLACREGMTPTALEEAGIEFKESQIELLLATHLLLRDGHGELYTTFPILDAGATAKLRAETAAIASEWSERLAPEIDALRERLRVAGLEEHAYSIYFSYVLDGLVWGILEEYGKVAPRRLSVARPFWSGQIWALRPARAFAANTQSVSKEGLTLKVTGGNVAHESIAALVRGRDAVRRALARVEATGRVDDESLRQALEQLGLVGAEGLWAIPVIDEFEKGPLFRAALALATAVVDALIDPERLDLAGIRERHGFRGDSQTLVITYHELMWDLMERLEAAGTVTRPAVLSDAAGASVAAAASVTFVVDRRRPAADRGDAIEPKIDEAPDPPPGGPERRDKASEQPPGRPR